ncbi:MAG: hypothetical protein IJV34_03090 [Prevotella sp.]|nr:hypothetical protein [Prevotella sp.]
MRYLLDTNIFIYAAIDRDPSDHVIIAHAITNGMPLVSSDRKFKFYEDQGLELVFNEK